MAYTAQYGTAVYGDSNYGLLLLNCSGGSYAITGGNATFTVSRAVRGNAGAYAITGNSAGYIYDKVLQGNAGNYTLTGGDAGLVYNQTLAAQAGSYTLTGNSASFAYNQVIQAGAFSYLWSGKDAKLAYSRAVQAQPGSYAITGGEAAFAKGKALNAGAGSFTLTGQHATLNYNPIQIVVESKGGLPKKKGKSKLEIDREQREELEAIVKREFDILDGTYQPETVEAVKQTIIPQIKQIDWAEYQIALAQVNELLLKAKIQMAEYESELDDEESLLMLL